MPKIIEVVGARPNFIKMAPLHRALRAAGFDLHLVHTGQHYDARMSDVFFRQLELPEPDTYLGVGSASHAVQTARLLEAFEHVVLAEAPDLVLVVGDVNSTLACALVAAKLHVPVAHVEAGLRSGDRRMPEEVNRLVVDRLSDYLFVTEQSGLDHLRREGVPEARVVFVGNVMIDALVRFRAKAAATAVLDDLALDPASYVLMTMHRPSNVDHAGGLRELAALLERLAAQRPVVFPMHPRTRARLAEHGHLDAVLALDGVTATEPLGYLEFIRLLEQAALVVTDSGGLQEETTFFGVPCLTLRENTERPITLTHGTNELLDLDAERVAERVAARLAAPRGEATPPPLWDGHAAERIAAHLAEALA